MIHLREEYNVGLGESLGIEVKNTQLEIVARSYVHKNMDKNLSSSKTQFIICKMDIMTPHEFIVRIKYVRHV